MKPGDKVRHKLSGDEMRIRKVYPGVAVCGIVGTEVWNPMQGKYQEQTAICAYENLEPLETKEQLTLNL